MAYAENREESKQEAPNPSGTMLSQLVLAVREDRYKMLLFVSLMMGVALGSFSRAIYGGGEWNGVIAGYCVNFLSAFGYVAPVTLTFAAAMLLCAPFRLTRLLICPAVCLRGMGLGSLLCAVMQAEGTRGVCFAALVMLPYGVVNALIAVYGGEYALGMRHSFEQGHTRLTKGLVLHTVKMSLFYLGAAGLSCVVFAASCVGFGRYLM